MNRARLGYQVLIAIAAAVIFGLFLGPSAKIFKPIGDIFIMLLQMIVLPYISFSIIHGLGSLAPIEAKQIFKKGWLFWLLLWLLAFYIVFLLCKTIPTATYGAFIPVQKKGVAEDPSQNILSFLIPENPFYDLANNVVPSIAIFAVIVGIALMHIEKKEPLLAFLERSNEVINKLLDWLAILSPIAVFAHIAVISGTVNFEDLSKLEFYICAFTAGTLIIVFWVLPLLLTCLTPMSFSEVWKAFRTVCFLSFVTGVPTIAIPFINQVLIETEGKYHFKKEIRNTSQTVIPLAYAFGQIGNALLLFRIFFMAFYYRHPFSGSEMTLISLLTMPLSIGSSATSINAMTFLIKQLGFPAEAIDLFSQTMSLTINFQIIVSVAGILTLILLILFSYYNMLVINWRKLIFLLGGSLAVLTILVFGSKSFIHIKDKYRDHYMNLSVNGIIDKPVAAKVYLPDELIPDAEQLEPGDTVLKRILKTGVLRVGYYNNDIPYSYFNERNELAGHDIAMAYQLAKDLNCTIEFIPVQIERLTEELNEGRYDIGMGAFLMSEDRILKVNFSQSYAEQNNVLVVPVKKIEQYKNFESVASRKGLRVGAVGAYEAVRDQYFPLAIPVNGTIDILTDGKSDVWIWSHIEAFVWCLNHQDYVVADYPGLMGKSLFGYPVKMEALEFLNYVNNWMTLQTLKGFSDRQYKYWIVGEDLKKQPRWSIMHNVLHWTQ